MPCLAVGIVDDVLVAILVVIVVKVQDHIEKIEIGFVFFVDRCFSCYCYCCQGVMSSQCVIQLL